MGVPSHDIIIENRSADTYKNGIETAKILDHLKLKNVFLYHMIIICCALFLFLKNWY
ncbi:MAG: hypothetical protein CM1200mP30_26660 [Pseudomonadota bacterium]|nr:MAG: hypothetical protein CM1200mP30_26660 [Pseudomonadota bacterium]